MKIISWNTYLAPTMPNRFVRKKYVVNKIKEWINENVDIIALQEVNDINIGILGYIYMTFKLFTPLKI
jgi:endonuclease/exonuclease/phosphatase family metal-dependent hydrolase